MTATIPAIPKASVPARLAALQTAPIAELKDQWRSLFGKEPPPFSRTYIQSRLAYRIQELAYGGLKPEIVARLEALGEQLDGGNIVLRRIRHDAKPIAGTRLIREWKGVEHHVTVMVDGYAWQGRPYKSLSAIARAITGTRWNGLVFFGIKNQRGDGMSKKPTAVAMRATVRKVRCAIYTRKSTDEGLDKEFNTLDAQRDACEAYIASQRHEGWVAIQDRYNDGGFSGGTLERPALKRLLADVEAGRVDVVVTYKLDRLSRSLTDFVKLMETLDAHGTTFVSVTQAFNTTTSMGRLTLNILLSFAQFEREVIGERIRDKFAASRARGMWMGGTVPLGYDVQNRKLVINEPEAAIVRMVFERYVEARSATTLARALREEGVTTKRGKPIDKSDVYKMLNNHNYVGDAHHKGNIYPGEHQAIVSRDLWNQAHTILQISPRTRANENRAQSPALLRGLIFGTDGRALSPSFAVRRGKQYRYYVAQAVLKGEPATDATLVRRISATEIEAVVMAQVRALVRQPEVVVGTWIAAKAEAPDLTEDEVRDALERLGPMWDELFPAEQARIVQLLVERVTVGPTGADIQLRVEGLASLVHDLGAGADMAVAA